MVLPPEQIAVGVTEGETVGLAFTVSVELLLVLLDVLPQFDTKQVYVTFAVAVVVYVLFVSPEILSARFVDH